MTSLSIPFPIAEALGLSLPKTTRLDSKRALATNLATDNADMLAVPKQVSLDLLPQELHRINRDTKHINPALACLDRQRDSVNDQRLLKQALGTYSVLGLWSSAISFIKWGVRVAHSQHERIRKLEHAISEEVSELKRVTERVVVPALAKVRQEFRGRSFIRDDQTPKALLMISVPSEKVGKVFSFDALRITIDTRKPPSDSIREVPNGDGRIVLERTYQGKRQLLELAYRRPGKVDVYVNGERRGSMWNDDALSLADAFMAGRSIPLEKRTRSSEYTIV